MRKDIGWKDGGHLQASLRIFSLFATLSGSCWPLELCVCMLMLMTKKIRHKTKEVTKLFGLDFPCRQPRQSAPMTAKAGCAGASRRTPCISWEMPAQVHHRKRRSTRSTRRRLVALERVLKLPVYGSVFMSAYGSCRTCCAGCVIVSYIGCESVQHRKSWI